MNEYSLAKVQLMLLLCFLNFHIAKLRSFCVLCKLFYVPRGRSSNLFTLFRMILIHLTFLPYFPIIDFLYNTLYSLFTFL